MMRDELIAAAICSSERARKYMEKKHPARQWVDLMRELRVTIEQLVEELRQ